MTASELAKQASDIFVLSDSFLQIKALIDDESSTIDDIADVILVDPALAASVLKLANSSFFNYPRKIDTLSKAILVLGITEIYNLVIAKCTSDAFKDLDADSKYLDNFWLDSVFTALVIKALGHQLKVPNAERLFVLGLLHNLGELVVAHYSPEVVEQATPGQGQLLPWHKQTQLLGFSYAQCSAELFKCWQLPFSIVEPIRRQDQDEELSSLNIDVKLLNVAKRMMLRQAYYDKLNYTDLINEQLLNELSLTEQDLNKALEFAQVEQFSILAIIAPNAANVF